MLSSKYKVMPQIREFQNEYRWLSNFWPAKIGPWPSVEHAYVSAKIGILSDSVEGYSLRNMTAGQAKRYGRKKPILPGFEENKLELMRNLITLKFGPDNPELMQKLIDTAPAELYEGNTWGDTFWGVVWDRNSPVGRNQLGKLLMQRREELLAGEIK